MIGPDNALDTTAAEKYERLLAPALNAAPAADAVAIAMLRPGERVLDVACGTGIVVRAAAPRVAPGGSVTGADIDPAMLAVAQSVVRAPDGGTITWHRASAQAMPFGNGAFDAAFCLQGLQYFPDCAAALREIRRVLSPGGRLVAVVWSALEDCKGQLALAHALERRGVDALAIHKAYSFGGAVRLRALADEAGFQRVEVSRSSTAAFFGSAADFVEAFASGSLSSRAAIAKVPEGERDGFLDEIAADLRQYEDGSGVSLPLGYLTLAARA